MRSIVELDLIQVHVPFDGHVVELPSNRIIDYVGVVNALPGDETRWLADILQHELSLFDAFPGKTMLLEQAIRLKENVVPIKQRQYPRNPAVRAIINEEVIAMLRDEVIETTGVNLWFWFANHFCIDMRRVNDSSIKDAYPLPRINAILEKLQTQFLYIDMQMKSKLMLQLVC